MEICGTTRTVEAETREDKIRHIGREIVDNVLLGNDGFNVYVSISRSGASKKEAPRPEYLMREHNNGKGVLDGLSEA